MRKTIKKIIAVTVAVISAMSASAFGASALNICVGGKCYQVTLPSCTSGNCGTLPISLRYTVSAPKCTNGTDCTNGTNCTPAQSSVPTVSTGSVPTGGDAASSVEVADVLTLVNSARSENGLSALALDGTLCSLAEIRAKEIVRSFSHTRPNGTSCFTVLKENGVSYRYAGENLAYGQTSAAAVMRSWLNSAGHRANILGKNFTKIGIACYISGGRKYWVQVFTG